MRHRWSLALATPLFVVLTCTNRRPSEVAPNAQWIGTWTASQQLTEPRNLPPLPGLSGSTLRQIVRVSIGGQRLRVRFSNAFGTSPVAMRSVHIAQSAGGSAIKPESDRSLTFHGSLGVVLAAGGEATSDPVDFALPPLADLSLSIHFAETSPNVTGHPGSRTTSYLQSGDHTSAVALPLPSAIRTEHWYILSGIDVLADDASAAVVVLGNSITDGRGSGTDKNNRWPDNLAQRLQADAATSRIAVLNAGVGGNAVLRGGLGPTALARFDHDVLSQSGVRWVLVLEGVNDIGNARTPAAAAAVADELIGAYRAMITRAHARSLRIYGATILPFGGSFYHDAPREAARQSVNRWIRTSQAFDAVIDFDAVMRDTGDSTRLRSDADGGDHLHPNEAGYRIMADAIDLSLFARADTLRLARLFSDGVVLQRDAPIPIWGWATPLSSVSVTLSGHTRRAVASSTGTWEVSLPALAAGGPYELVVDGRGRRLTAHDVLVGDVWIASGQSNMEWRVADVSDAAREITSARDTKIRQFKVPHSWSESPEDELAGGSWIRADSQHVGAFTGVGYFFAKELRTTVAVPIGIINNAWSGSAIEPWISRQAQRLDDTAWAEILTAERRHQTAARDTLIRRLGTLPNVDSGLVAGQALWANPSYNDASWSSIRVPGGWEQTFPGLDGIAWYRTTFTLSEAEAKQGARLSLATVDDADITWVNGVEVGRTSGYNIPRRYELPAAALRAGRNTLAVRVVDGGGGGGIIGTSTQLFIEVAGVRYPLGGPWRFKVAVASLAPDEQRVNRIPTFLYNKMLHPLLRYPIKGVIWYQGESNANTLAQAAAYRMQFATLIQSWRREWRAARGDFPFLWVQLPNFGAVDSLPPTQAAWAVLRESQAAALTLPRTGQAVTIDVGEPNDLHPRNKQDPGRRLALLAREVAYGASLVASGPTYKRHSISDREVIVEFDHVRAGLASRVPAARVTGFAIAGADRKFVWAEARIERERVVVWSDRIAQPVAVRYAWANSPANPSLFNREGLPAAPFRTDEW